MSSFLSTLTVSNWCALGMSAFATFVAVVTLFFQPASYGKNLSTAEGKPKDDSNLLVKILGPRLPARVGWMLMESPALIASLLVFFIEAKADHINVVSLVLLGLFDLHYTVRSIIYPQLIKSTPMPVGTVLLAFFFCSINGFQQSYSLFVDGPIRPASALFSSSFLLGVLIFFCGFLINQHSDYLLRSLRSSGSEKRYQIPYGGFFEYVSAANYFGEIVEWTGYAIASGTMSAYSFAYFTAAMLGSRAVGYHQWYVKEFGEKYPKKRKAIIPFLY